MTKQQPAFKQVDAQQSPTSFQEPIDEIEEDFALPFRIGLGAKRLWKGGAI